MPHGGSVYMMGSNNGSTIYTGVTSDLVSRVIEHRDKLYPNSFTAKYNCIKLLYYETSDHIESAIAEEKRIKGSSRRKKELLISNMNPEWKDLWDDIKYW